MDGTRYGSRVPQRADHWHAVKSGFENCCAGDCAEAQKLNSVHCLSPVLHDPHEWTMFGEPHHLCNGKALVEE